MTQIWIQKRFAPIKKYSPGWIHNPIRRLATALMAPMLFSFRTGHFRSSLIARAVQKNGEPLPWYTYPSIDFLKNRNYEGKTVLEFGAGQSTLWWARRAKHVVALEGDPEWYDRLKRLIPANVELHLVSVESPEACVADVDKILSQGPEHYDLITIDGLHRFEMTDFAKKLMAKDGAIIVDNAEGYGIYEAFHESDLRRVDFYGHCPGVVLPHSTSIFFHPESFLFEPQHRISVIAKDG